MLTSSNCRKTTYFNTQNFFIACFVGHYIYQKSAIFLKFAYFIIFENTRMNVKGYILCDMIAGYVNTYLKPQKFGVTAQIFEI